MKKEQCKKDLVVNHLKVIVQACETKLRTIPTELNFKKFLYIWFYFYKYSKTNIKKNIQSNTKSEQPKVRIAFSNKNLRRFKALIRL